MCMHIISKCDEFIEEFIQNSVIVLLSGWLEKISLDWWKLIWWLKNEKEPAMWRIALKASKRENSIHKCPKRLEPGVKQLEGGVDWDDAELGKNFFSLL